MISRYLYYIPYITLSYNYMQDIEIPSSGELLAMVLQCSLQSIHSLLSSLSSSFIIKMQSRRKNNSIRDGSVLLYLRVLWSEAMSWVKKVNKSYLHFWTFRPKLSQERTLSYGRNSNELLTLLWRLPEQLNWLQRICWLNVRMLCWSSQLS